MTAQSLAPANICVINNVACIMLIQIFHAHAIADSGNGVFRGGPEKGPYFDNFVVIV